MRRIDDHRWLLVLAVFTALVPLSSIALAQAATMTSATPPENQQTTNSTLTQPAPEELGDALMTHQRYQAAIAAYKLAPHYKTSALLMNKLGIAYQMMFNLDDATRCYKASLKLDSHNPRVLNNLGTVYDSLRNFRKAESMYRKALKYEPGSALILKNLGSDQLAQHKYKEGWETYKAALAQDPKIFENSANLHVKNPASGAERGAMNYYMAKGCVRAGQTDRAIEYLRMALNEGFTNPKKIIADSEFASLRGLPAFEQLLAAETTP